MGNKKNEAYLKNQKGNEAVWQKINKDNEVSWLNLQIIFEKKDKDR